MSNKLKILYIRGKGSKTKTDKAEFLGKLYDVKCIEMDTSNHEECYKLQENAIKDFNPDLVVGSSFGGYLACRLLNSGVWKGPTVLLAQEYNRYENNKGTLPPYVPVILIHSRSDEVVPFEGSLLLSKTGTPGLVELIEVKDDHHLHGTMASGVLVKAIKRAFDLKKHAKRTEFNNLLSSL